MSLLKKLFGDKAAPEKTETKEAQADKDNMAEPGSGPDTAPSGESPTEGEDNYWSDMLNDMVDEAGFGTEVD